MLPEEPFRIDLSNWRRECPEESFREMRQELEAQLPEMASKIPLAILQEAVAYYEAERLRLLTVYPELETTVTGDPWRPSEQEFDVCEKVIPIFRLEIARRQNVSAQPTALASESTTTNQLPHRKDPEVAKREAIVRQNPKVPSQGICELFDEAHIPLPKGWLPQKWSQAHKSEKYRSRIQVIISKDKKKPT